MNTDFTTWIWRNAKTTERIVTNTNYVGRREISSSTEKHFVILLCAIQYLVIFKPSLICTACRRRQKQRVGECLLQDPGSCKLCPSSDLGPEWSISSVECDHPRGASLPRPQLSSLHREWIPQQSDAQGLAFFISISILSLESLRIFAVIV